MNNRGSITLEAAIILPFVFTLFYSFFLVLDYLKSEIALKTTVSNAVYQISYLYYPIEIAKSTLIQSQAVQPLLELTQTVSGLTGSISFLSEIKTDASQKALTKMFTPFIRQHVPDKTIDPKHVNVEFVRIPGESDNKDMLLQFDVSYSPSYKIPFFSKSIKIKKSAVERVWIGDTSPILLSIQNQVQIRSVSPNPVRRGSVATIVAQVHPYANTDIKVVYKSGLSVAKGLSAKNADSTGRVFWTWNVGGNTTPGQWTIKVTSNGQTDLLMFEVLQK